jgi:hypothetical protein
MSRGALRTRLKQIGEITTHATSAFSGSRHGVL